jgi:hypothetical protein
MKEPVAVFVVDYLAHSADTKLAQTLRRLKQVIHRRYKQFGRPQEVVWITTEPVSRIL